ncbi:hypothetical protein E3P85_01114 [Wallemia ichthyophaga]|nr:hypothetical protein E3P85_01114 [Wallemia ichthyophaga]
MITLGAIRCRRVVSLPRAQRPRLPQLALYSTNPKESTSQAQKLDSVVLPPPRADASLAGRWWHKGKTLVIFYWRGIKQIWLNRQVVRQIEARQQSHPLTHREFQLVSTHKKDIKKLVPFAILFVLLEEIIPLIAYLAPQVLPSTDVLPSQKVSIRRAVERRQKSALETYRNAYNEATRRQLESGLSGGVHMSPHQVTLFLKLLDLSTKGTSSMRQKRLERYLAHISQDDECILGQEVENIKATAFLSEGEVSDACSARGFLTLDVKDEDLTKLLNQWLHHRHSDNIYKPLHLILNQSGYSNDHLHIKDTK